MALTIGEAAMVADDMPNNEATGLTHTPTQAPPLQTENKMGATEASPPVMVVQIVFFSFIILISFFF